MRVHRPLTWAVNLTMPRSKEVMDQVFDSIERTLSGGADGLISHFDYLNSSDRVEAQRVREMIEECYTHYPEGHRASLVKRLRSHSDVAHLSASFELILHELLLRAGCSVSLPAQGSNVPRKPDFEVTALSGESFYLEATLATGRSHEEGAAGRRLEEAYRAIDSVRSPDFFLTIEPRGTPSQPVSGRRLKRRVNDWLADLDYDAAADGADVPPLVHEEHGCRFEIGAIPRHRTRGMPDRRAIGVRGLTAEWTQPRDAVRRRVTRKASRYGELDRPFIVAVNALQEATDEEEVIEALLGSVSVIVRRGHGGPAVADECRNPDGAWHGPSGPTNTRVSAVLSTERLSFWSLGQRRLCVCHNPWAARPMASLPLDIDRYEPVGSELRRSSGRSVAELFGLAEGWPELSSPGD